DALGAFFGPAQVGEHGQGPVGAELAGAGGVGVVLGQVDELVQQGGRHGHGGVGGLGGAQGPRVGGHPQHVLPVVGGVGAGAGVAGDLLESVVVDGHAATLAPH